MATFKKLQYSLGGGIISAAQQDVQNGTATIAIGLGGTGKDAVKHLKKEIYQRIAPDNPNESVPQYSHIKFLSIDTDEADLWNEEDIIGIDADSEFFTIAGNVNIFENPDALASKQYAKWLSNKNLTLQSNQGAGGVRQIGRYFLIDKSNTLVTKLSNLFTAAVKDLPTNDVNIHIMSGLGGGTGAGTFLDVCYILKHAIKICPALTGKNVKICGYFFMPDVNLAVIQQQSVRDYVQANSFAVMKELDYCMNFADNGGRWEQQYNGFAVNSTKTPVDICYLISSQAVSGNVVSKGYEYAMGVVSDYIVQFISDNAINMNTHIANYAKMESELVKPHGGNYKYAIIGSAHSIVPMREVSTYLASCLFERMAASWSNEPKDTDIADFCEKLGLNCDKLINDIGGYNIRIPEIDNVYNKIPTDDTGDQLSFGYVLPAGILNPFIQQETKIKGEVFAKGRDALTNEWKPGMELDDNPISIVCRVYKALDEVVRDLNKGPVYAAKMLFGSDKKNIINVITGVYESAKIKRDDLYTDIDLTVAGVKRARKAYNDRGIFSNKKELFGSLLSAIKNDIAKRCEYERCRLLCEALDTAKTQLLALYNDYFEKYSAVITDLTKVFKDNKFAISELQDVTTDPFTLPLFKISEVRQTLDADVEKLGISSVIDQFNIAFFKGAYDVWHNGNEDKIAKWISDYMSEAFKEYVELSLDDHIKSMYPDIADSGDTAQLIATVRTNIINKLDSMASELFLLDSAKAPHVGTENNTVSYCSAPATAPLVNSAIESYKSIHPGVHQVTGRNDRIFILKSAPCVPMFAYGLVDQNYTQYGLSHSAGKHLYEGTPGDLRDWKTLLPNLRPYSLYQSIDWTTEEKKETADAYGASEAAGIIHCEVKLGGIDTDNYYLWRTPDYMPKIDAAKALVAASRELAATELTDANAEDLLAQLESALDKATTEMTSLKDYKEGLIDHMLTYQHDAVNDRDILIKPEIAPVAIRNDGDNSTAAAALAVRRDNVLSSPVIVSIMMEELNKHNAYNDVMAQMEEIKASLEAKCTSVKARMEIREKGQPIFINALLSGVISYSNRHLVTFENKDEFGIELTPTIELSKLSFEPFGNSAPLYQAFNAYCELSDEIRGSIQTKVSQRLNGEDENGLPKDWTAEMKTAYDNISAVVTSDYASSIVAPATKGKPEYAEIMSLYKAFLLAQRTFCQMNGLV